MSRLSWISDDRLTGIVLTMLARAQEGVDKSSARIRKNVIDPFSSLVMAAAVSTPEAERLSAVQQVSSASSAISNAVGNFHQEILGAVGGFQNHDAGYDLECKGKKILAEVKNKHNTMNASNRQAVIDDLDTAVRHKADSWVAYLVIVIPNNPVRYRKKLTKREVYETDGASFYEMATGFKTALHDLYYAVEDITAEHYPDLRSKTALEYCKNALKAGVPA